MNDPSSIDPRLDAASSKSLSRWVRGRRERAVTSGWPRQRSGRGRRSPGRTRLLLGGLLAIFVDGPATDAAEPRQDLWNGAADAPLHVPAGFSTERVAGPPLVQHPTMACFDDRGRLFVCESAGLNLTAEELEEQRPNSIKMLVDRDGDGQFDQATVFADQMTFPMGAAWHDGALYVASPPNIWRLADTDDDGVADQREVLVDRFGFTGNAASIHGCFLAPDGRLYWCDGYHGHEFRDADGQIVSKRVGSYLFSCRPDGSDVQIHAGGGMDNPVEVDFTSSGDVLGTVNILYTRPRVDALVHWLYGGAYPHRRQVLDELKVTGDLLGPVHRFGHVAVSGMMRYRSGALDPRWQDQLFTTFFNSGQVVRLELTPDGSTYTATQRPFLSSESRDFHPTDVLEDADGSLLVVDTGGWFYRGCPTSQFSKPDVLGGIYRVRRDGMTPRNDPWGNAIDWAATSDQEMIRLTNDPRFQVRRRAIAELVRRGERVIPALQQTMQTSEVQMRRAAVWALSRIAQGASRGSASTAGKRAEVRRDALDALQRALSDRAPTIRQAACHCLAMHRDDAALSALQAMLGDAVPAVRRVAGQALGRIGDPAAVPDLLIALGGAVDRAERHALTYALIEIDDAKATAQAFQDFAPQQGADQAATLEGALNALDQMDHGSLDGSLVVSLLDAEDPGLRRAALRILQTHPAWYPLAVAKLEALLASPIPSREAGEWVAALLATLLEQPSVQQRVGSLLAESDGAEDPRRRLILETIGRHRLGTLPPSWEEPLAEMLQSEDPRWLEATLAAVGAIATDRFDDVLRQLGDNQRLPRTLRVSAYEAISGRGNRLETPLFTLLLAMLGTEGTPAEASRASRTLAAASLDAAQLQRLLPHLRQAGPMQLANLMTPFARTQDAATAEAFLEGVDGAKGLAGVTPSVFSDTIKRFPASALPRANRLLARLQANREAKIARLDALLPLVRQGDPQRGKTLFFSDRAKCSSCHRVGEQGGRIGPDLTTIGANRATLDLLESTVFPSASIVRDYEPCQVLTLDGRLLAGIIIDQTATSLTLQQQTGEPLQFPREEIEAIETSTVSLMPSGLEEALSEQELADVIAYLSRLR